MNKVISFPRLSARQESQYSTVVYGHLLRVIKWSFVVSFVQVKAAAKNNQ